MEIEDEIECAKYEADAEEYRSKIIKWDGQLKTFFIIREATEGRAALNADEILISISKGLIHVPLNTKLIINKNKGISYDQAI